MLSQHQDVQDYSDSSSSSDEEVSDMDHDMFFRSVFRAVGRAFRSFTSGGLSGILGRVGGLLSGGSDLFGRIGGLVSGGKSFLGSLGGLFKSGGGSFFDKLGGVFNQGRDLFNSGRSIFQDARGLLSGGVGDSDSDVQDSWGRSTYGRAPRVTMRVNNRVVGSLGGPKRRMRKKSWYGNAPRGFMKIGNRVVGSLGGPKRRIRRKSWYDNAPRGVMKIGNRVVGSLGGPKRRIRRKSWYGNAPRGVMKIGNRVVGSLGGRKTIRRSSYYATAQPRYEEEQFFQPQYEEPQYQPQPQYYQPKRSYGAAVASRGPFVSKSKYRAPPVRRSFGGAAGAIGRMPNFGSSSSSSVRRIVRKLGNSRRPWHTSRSIGSSRRRRYRSSRGSLTRSAVMSLLE
eukprot:TRINITY_DN1043_c0_g1_i10.p1 TRINITY_DN1043_c0_g1~~TRINITY_DN1043_c0_g1_i10.p1  ORF type:complete len:395 (+),score=100.20 TRINITY_DN1043_c0_g1_i10:523-1707(+)